MTFDEFVNSRRGKGGWGTNPSDKGECLGLLNDGEVQMRGILYPIQGITYARDFLNGNNTRPDIYERVVNDPNSANQVPSKGDMIVWGNVGDARGHVAYVIDAPQGVNSVQVFDQWQGAPAQIRNYTYSTCKGWWHLKPQTPPEPAIGATQRKVGSAGVKYRKEPNTNSELLITDVIHDGIVDGGQIANLVGYVNGQNVDGNDVWFKGTGGGYMWSGGFENPSTDGLPRLTYAPETPEQPPAEPPYTFVPDLACVTAVKPAANSNFQHGNFPEKPEKAVIHDFGTLGKDTFAGTLAWFANPASETSAHFVISGKNIVQMVSLSDRAYHAGSKGNGFVGIETDPAQDQDTVNSVRTVLEQLKAKYGYQLALIKHSEIMATSCGDDVDLAKYDISPPIAPESPTESPQPPVTPPEPDKPVTPPENGSETLLDVVKRLISKLIDWLSSWKRG